jgi:hypothetical protein
MTYTKGSEMFQFQHNNTHEFPLSAVNIYLSGHPQFTYNKNMYKRCFLSATTMEIFEPQHLSNNNIYVFKVHPDTHNLIIKNIWLFDGTLTDFDYSAINLIEIYLSNELDNNNTLLHNFILNIRMHIPSFRICLI